jgi:hypothetical protein
MFRIVRGPLQSEIWNLSRSNSVLITGSPGSGKSWTIAQFVRQCKAEKRSCLPLVAEDFSVESLEQLRVALGFKSDVLSFVSSLSHEPVVVIDGLDALRSEPSQRTFRELIRQISLRAPKCTVVASIRTFDLQQSEELKTLFFSKTADAFGRGFQQVTVPPLTDVDLHQAISQAPVLQSLLTHARGEFRDLLRNPFNLHLTLQLLETGIPSDEISYLHTQVQLLTRYWDWRVGSQPNSYDREAFLRAVLEKMVEARSLSIPQTAVYQTGQGPILSALQSDEILKESVTNRLSFVHNILFDYGVARLLLDEQSIQPFIQTDRSRTIFFRPSLAYFFHYLWFRGRALFWTVAFRFFSSAVLPERARILPAIAICEAARTTEDFEPLLAGTSAANISGITATLRSLQALDGLKGTSRKIWIDMLLRLSGRLDLSFVNEYVVLLSRADEGKSSEESPSIYASAVALLRWMWATADKLPADGAVSIATVAAGRVLPIVIKNYSQNIAESRKIVNSIFERFGSPRSGPNEAFFLVGQLPYIVESDPDTAVEVCRQIFAFNEPSQEKTQIGSSVVMSFTSTRAQDFSSARYAIQAKFPAFIRISPVHAATAAIHSLNAEVARDRSPGQKAGEAKMEFAFTFAGAKAIYQSDYSEIWDTGGSRDYVSLNLFGAVLNAISKLLESPDCEDTARAMVAEIARYASFAVSWKRLLQAVVFNSPSLYPLISELLTVPHVLSAPETTIVAGEALSAAYAAKLVKLDEAVKIEQAILEIPNAVAILRYEKPESIRNRLLTCIPTDQLRSDALKKIAEELLETKQVRANEPYHRMSFEQMPFGTNEWLREQGVNPSAPDNAELLKALEPLQSFEQKYPNEIPSAEECEKIEPVIEALRALLRRDAAHGTVQDAALGTLCAVAEAILKNGKLGADQSVVRKAREIVLDGAKSKSPEFNPKYHLPFELPSWGGSSPRIESAQGLSQYLWNWGLDADVVKSILQLSEDKVPAVRYQIAERLVGFYKQQDKDTFWRVLTKMLASEQTHGVLLALLQAVWRVSGPDTDRAEAVLLDLFQRELPTSERSELTRTLMQMLVGLYVVRDRIGSRDRLIKIEDDPVRFHREVTEEIYAASACLRPPNGKEPEIRLRARETLIRVVSSVYKRLDLVQQEPNSEEKFAALGKLLHLLDHVATRLFFSLDPTPSDSLDSTSPDRTEARQHYFDIKPILELLTLRPSSKQEHLLRADTAHYLMQTLNAVLPFDPATVITYAAAVCRASRKFSYHYDPMAIDEMQKLVERVLADHKDVLRTPEAANAIGEMLDTFVTAGWATAMRLTFRLDEAIR